MKNVLLIDDDPDDAMFFSDALTELNLPANFRYVGSGLETMPELRRKDGYTPDVIFLDINMPGYNGWECLRELKAFAEFAQIPIIMYSTSASEHERLATAKIGAVAFITKPNSYEALKSQLHKVLNALL